MEKKLLKIVLLTDADCGQAWPDISPCLQDGAVIIARLELTGLPDRESGGNLLFKLYQILDLALSRPPAKSARISRRSVKPNDLKLKLRELGADCLVWLSDYPLPLDLAEILPLGVLCFDPLGDSRGARRFFRAMASQKTSLATRLLHVEAGRTRELGRAATGLEPLSLARNLAQARSKVGGLAARALRLLLHKDLDEPLEAAVAESEPYTLSLALSLKFLLSLACFGLGDLWRNLFYRKQWFLAWRPQSTGAPWDNPQKFQPLYPPHGLGRADPFIFEKDGETFILYEEIPESTRRGVLGAAGFAHGQLSEARVFLDAGCHLSYPFVFKHLGETYMIPESGQRGRVDLFRALDFPDHWRRERTLLKALRPVDASLCEQAGLYWLFVNQAGPGGTSWDGLHLYFAEHPFGPYTAHPLNPVLVDAGSARPAGKIFTWQGRLIRPSQDCAGAYGRAVVFNEITRLDKQGYAERVIAKMGPQYLEDSFCLHTFNAGSGLELADGQRYLPRWRIFGGKK